MILADTKPGDIVTITRDNADYKVVWICGDHANVEHLDGKHRGNVVTVSSTTPCTKA